MVATIDRINELSAERSTLFRLGANGRRGDPEVLARIQQIGQELEKLWERRRRERAGRLEGIDLVVDSAYREAYGPSYEEALKPAPLMETGDQLVPKAA